MLTPDCVRIMPLARSEPMSGHLSLQSTAISGLSGGVGTAYGLISTCLDGPIEPLFLRF